MLQSVSVYANLLLTVCLVLKLNSTVNKSEECIILTDTNVVTGMNSSASLSNKNVTCENCLAVCSLYAETLGLRVTTVLCRTYALLMSKEL